MQGNPVLPDLYPFRLDAGLIDTVPFSFIETLFSSKDAEAAGNKHRPKSGTFACHCAKHFPRELAGVFPPGAIPAENRQAILIDLRSRGIRQMKKVTWKKASDDEHEL